MEFDFRKFKISLMWACLYIIGSIFLVPQLLLSILSDNWMATLIVVYILPLILFYLLLGGFVIFLIVGLWLSKKGNRLKTVVPVVSGYLIVFIVLVGFNLAKGYSGKSYSTSVLEKKKSLIESAINEKNKSYCEVVYDTWYKYEKSFGKPSSSNILISELASENNIRHRSQLKEDDCYFWIAYITGDYDFCNYIKDRRDERNNCFKMAAIKKADIRYCHRMTGVYNTSYSDECVSVMTRLLNNASYCELINTITQLRNYKQECYLDFNQSTRFILRRVKEIGRTSEIGRVSNQEYISNKYRHTRCLSLSPKDYCDNKCKYMDTSPRDCDSDYFSWFIS